MITFLCALIYTEGSQCNALNELPLKSLPYEKSYDVEIQHRYVCLFISVFVLCPSLVKS